MSEKNTTIKKSVTIAGHRTSVSLEEPFWNALKTIACTQKKSVNKIIAEIDATNPKNLSSALRIYVLEYYKKRPDAACVQKPKI